MADDETEQQEQTPEPEQAEAPDAGPEPAEGSVFVQEGDEMVTYVDGEETERRPIDGLTVEPVPETKGDEGDERHVEGDVTVTEPGAE